jgi:spore coat polysaccharide biosynthesis protein SpsF
MTGVFLQARLDSSRLPNKALLELGGRTAVEHAMLSLRRVPATVHALLTDEASATLLAPRAARAGFRTFVGPRDNVLERYVLAAREFGVSTVVRATGDNPLVSWELARMAVREFLARGVDYFGYDGPPLGTGVEVVRASALERAIRETRDTYDTEHVTAYLYRNPAHFQVSRIQSPHAFRMPSARVTLDTQEDYVNLCAIYLNLYRGSPIPVFRLVRHLRLAQSSRFLPDTEAHGHTSRA